MSHTTCSCPTPTFCQLGVATFAAQPPGGLIAQAAAVLGPAASYCLCLLLHSCHAAYGISCYSVCSADLCGCVCLSERHPSVPWTAAVARAAAELSCRPNIWTRLPGLARADPDLQPAVRFPPSFAPSNTKLSRIYPIVPKAPRCASDPCWRPAAAAPLWRAPASNLRCAQSCVCVKS